MPALQTLAEIKGKPGVWRMYVADNRVRCGGGSSGSQDNLLVSDGKTQWMGHNSKYWSPFRFDDTWLYEPTGYSWSYFLKSSETKAPLKLTRKTLILCDITKLR